jgi:hypothetical protein
MVEARTTAVVQRYLDELSGDSPAEPIVRALLARAVRRLHLLCATLLFKSYPRLTQPPLNLQADELLGAVVERLLKALSACSPCSATRGGSVGTSLAPALEWRREHFHTARVGEFLDPLNPAVTSFLQQARAFYFQRTGGSGAPQEMALQTLSDLRQQQAVSLAYFDVFWLFGVLALALAPLVFLMKRSVAEKGEHVGAE